VNAVIRFAVGVGRFVYDFAVGDDLTVAVVVVLALALTAVAVARGVDMWWLVPVVAVLMTGVSLWRRRQRTA
jgi:hypothetical protein